MSSATNSAHSWRMEYDLHNSDDSMSMEYKSKCTISHKCRCEEGLFSVERWTWQMIVIMRYTLGGPWCEEGHWVLNKICLPSLTRREETSPLNWKDLIGLVVSWAVIAFCYCIFSDCRKVLVLMTQSWRSKHNQAPQC